MADIAFPTAKVVFRAAAIAQDSDDSGSIPQEILLGGIRVTLIPALKYVEVAAPPGGVHPTTYSLRTWNLITTNDGNLINMDDPEEEVLIVASDAFPGYVLSWKSIIEDPSGTLPPIIKKWLAPAGSIVDLTTVISVPNDPNPIADYLQAVYDAREARDNAISSSEAASSSAREAQTALVLINQARVSAENALAAIPGTITDQVTAAKTAKDSAANSATAANTSASAASGSATTASIKADEAQASAAHAASSAATASAAQAATEAVDITVGTVITGTPGTPAAAEILGTAPNFTLDLTIPRGDPGPVSSLSIGTVTTGAAGSSASASITGTAPEHTLDLTIPRGDAGNPTAYELRGTGMPNGVVTAPPGTYYTDTAGTNGAWRWLKTSGTGNTGWVVIHGDTGWRNVSFIKTANMTAGEIYLRRINERVAIMLVGAAITSIGNFTADHAWPAGFIISRIGVSVLNFALSGHGFSEAPTWITVQVPVFNNNVTLLNKTAGIQVNKGTGQGTFVTNDLWPTTLPGTPA